ncbi:type II toxin-antitoxin system RelE/ParE family toxin [Desulfobacca acetoxidans]
MKRPLLRSPAFVRAAQKLVKKNPDIIREFHLTLDLLAENAFHPKLKTHKLKGKLEGSWACSVDYDLRILFDFVTFQGKEAILLLTLGTHKEVY